MLTSKHSLVLPVSRLVFNSPTITLIPSDWPCGTLVRKCSKLYSFQNTNIVGISSATQYIQPVDFFLNVCCEHVHVQWDGWVEGGGCVWVRVAPKRVRQDTAY